MRIRVLLPLIILIVTTSGVWSQIPSKPFNIYAGGGITIPTKPSEFNDNYNLGYHGFAGLGLFVAPMIQAVGKIGLHSSTRDFDDFVDPNADGGDFTALTFGVDARLAIGAPVVPIKPFGFAGIGMSNIKRSDIEPSVEFVTEPPNLESITETKFYYNIGAGLEFKVGPGFTFFVQGAYIGISSGDISDEAIGLFPVSVGLKL